MKVLFLACAASAVLFVPLQAHAQVGAEEAACRAAIAKAAGKYTKTVQKVITGCHKLRDKEILAATIDCNDLAAADSKDKAAKVGDKLVAALSSETSKCSVAGTPIASVLAEFGRCPTPAETVDDGGATTGIDDYDELAACMLEHTVRLTQANATRILGLPSLPLSTEARKCRGAIAKGYSKVVDTTVKERAKCQSASDKAGGAFGFDCVLADPKGKIAKTQDKSIASIGSACAVAAPAAFHVGVDTKARATVPGGTDSCSDDAAALGECVISATASAAGSGIAAMLFELPGICPGSGSYIVAPSTTGTELDVGWTGTAHNRDPILGYSALQFTISCDVDCKACTSSSVDASPEACRCSGDASIQCDAPGADPLCTGAGTCECYYGPPTPYTAGSNAACVQSRFDGTVSGSLDPTSGVVALSLPLRHRLYLGAAINAPCPLCTNDVCEGGQRDGETCTVDATDQTFGAVSYDCPPSVSQNITGGGVFSQVDYTTGSVSLPFGTPCGFPPSFPMTCACNYCSGDGSIGCNSDADCAAKSAGTCTGSISGRTPNQCSSGTCTAVGGDEGECAGDTNSFCDGWTSNSGEGILNCSNNTDCLNYGPICPGGDCGLCQLVTPRRCFLDPINATGTPGDTIVGVGCIGQTSNTAVNQVLGLPGAYRVRQHLEFSDLLCSDGITEFIPPGGSNCP